MIANACRSNARARWPSAFGNALHIAVKASELSAGGHPGERTEVADAAACRAVINVRGGSSGSARSVFSVRHCVVDRPRARRGLDPGRDASLTLIAAPARYGKTTAVRAWCAGLDTAPAWVTPDASDNDPVLLWRYAATVVDGCRRGSGGTR